MTPLSVTEAEAIELVQAKIASAAAAVLKTFSTPQGEVDLLKGRFGPYLKWGKENVKIPRGTEPESLTADDVLELIAKHQPSTGAKGRGKSGAKSSGKTAGKAKGRAASTRTKK